MCLWYSQYDQSVSTFVAEIIRHKCDPEIDRVEQYEKRKEQKKKRWQLKRV